MDVLEEKKAEAIVLLDLKGHCSFTDYFIICTGTSERHLDALAEAVDTAARKQHRLKSPRQHGQAAGGWLLLDLGDVIIHLFSAPQREHYQLEQFWSAGKVVLRIQ